MRAVRMRGYFEQRLDWEMISPLPFHKINVLKCIYDKKKVKRNRYFFFLSLSICRFSRHAVFCCTMHSNNVRISVLRERERERERKGVS